MEGHRVELWLSSAMSLALSLARGGPLGAVMAAVAALAKLPRAASDWTRLEVAAVGSR